MKGIIPPQAIEVEMAILGAILIESVAFIKASGIINHETFYKESHGRIYKACAALSAKSEPIDILTVTSHLISTKELDLAGGAGYIVDLSRAVNSSANIERHCRIVLEMWMRRTLINVCSQNAQSAFDLSKDVFELLEKSQLELIKAVDMISKKKAETIFDKMQLVLETASNIILSRERGEPISSGLLTGCKGFDDLTGGKMPSNLIILAARPGMGKTAKMLEEARTMVLNGIPTLIFSLEMSAYELALRMVSIETGITNSNIKRGNLTHAEINRAIELIKKWENLGLYIDDSSGLHISEIRSKAIMAYSKLGIRKIYLDYLQLAKGDGGNREQQIATVSGGLKSLAKELNIPITALAQLSRQVEQRGGVKRPQLSDLRESGSIEQDADMVVFLYRPEYYGISEFEDGTSALKKLLNIIAKNRNGAQDDIMEYCEIACGRIGDKWEYRQDNYVEYNEPRKITVNSTVDWNNPSDEQAF